MNGELLRIVDAIRREKNIDAEIVFQGIELALQSAARKHFGTEEDVDIRIDRDSGNIEASLEGEPVDPAELGRIAAQTAKQVMIQKIREAERASLMEDYAGQVGSIITGQVTRVEHGNAVVNLGRGEGFLPRSEQIPGETLHVADRIRALIIDVRDSGSNVKIVLSRTHSDLIVRLFELEVPEVADQVIEIQGVAREPGHRTKVAVSSIDSRVDAVGACVGIRGSRIRNIVEEVAGEKIDIVRYNESPQVFIAEALKPAQVQEVLLNREINRATVLVAEDQLSLAIGKKGQNVRLAARLSGWNIDIMTREEFDHQRDDCLEQLASLEIVGPDLAAEIVDAGYISLADVAEVDPDLLASALDLKPDRTREIVQQAGLLLTELERQAAAEAQAPAEPEPEAAPEGEAEEPGEVEAEAEGTTEPEEAESEETTEPADETDVGQPDQADEPPAPEPEEKPAGGEAQEVEAPVDTSSEDVAETGAQSDDKPTT